jgi:ATP phosphoribosyltransferase
MRNLRVVLPKKKENERLLNESFCLAENAGFLAFPREDLPSISCLYDTQGALNNFEMINYRPEDALTFLNDNVAQIAVVGRDKFAEFKAANPSAPVSERASLPFGKCRLSFMAAVQDAPRLNNAADLRRWAGEKGRPLICATSYSSLVKAWAKENGLSDVVQPKNFKGGVELSVSLGSADFAMDVVESGNTMRKCGLTEIFDPIMQSSAVIVTRTDLPYADALILNDMVGRLKNGAAPAETETPKPAIIEQRTLAFA